MTYIFEEQEQWRARVLNEFLKPHNLEIVLEVPSKQERIRRARKRAEERKNQFLKELI